MLEHSFRTDLFGSMLAQASGVRVDEELVYVTCVLHDMRLDRPCPGHCFAASGGIAARDFALERGVVHLVPFAE